MYATVIPLLKDEDGDDEEDQEAVEEDVFTRESCQIDHRGGSARRASGATMTQATTVRRECVTPVHPNLQQWCSVDPCLPVDTCQGAVNVPVIADWYSAVGNPLSAA